MSTPTTSPTTARTPDPGHAGPKAGVIDPERPVGDVLVADGLLTPEQVDKALRIQARLEEWRPLGVLLIELGWVPRLRVDEALRKTRRALSIEEILVNRGLIRPEQLAAAVATLGGRSHVSPARHLVEAGTIPERVYLEAYCEKHELPFVDVDANLVDRQLLAKANLKYLARHRILPMSVQKGRLNVAADQPPAERMVQELERHYGAPVSIWIGEASKITGALAVLEAETTGRSGAKGGALQYRVVAQVNDDNRTAAEIVDAVLLRAIQQGASDIHFDPDRNRLRVRYRIDGELVRVGDYPSVTTPAVISRLKVLAEADIAEKRAHQQGRIMMKVEGEEIDVRASFYVTINGENAVLRLLRKTAVLVGLDELGFSQTALRSFVQDVLEPTTGMLLVTGPTGSGKTTTLYAAVQRLVDDTKKVITCEDPVEYLLEGVTQCSISERPGLTFADSLRSILRQDPDVILVGEVRDHESANMAIHCALTGHKVLTTLHTEDTVSAVVRLLQMDIEPFLVASTMSAVLGQRLLRRPCAHCRADHVPTAAEQRSLALHGEDLSAYTFTRSTGCPNCHYTGYRGRVGVYELLVMTDALRDAVLQKRPAHEIRRIAQESPGFYSLQEDGIAKALHGLTTLSEVIGNCPRLLTNRRLRQLQELY
jgi:type IV pilus assembly protein PilB